MKQSIEKALQIGKLSHKGGKLEEAERVYRAILEARPKHPEANHNLGTIMAATKNFGSALPFFKIAVDANPEIGQYWFSYIDALIREEQFDNANRVIERAKEQGVAEEELKALKGQLVTLNRQDNVGSLSPSQELLNSLLEHYQSGRHNDAEKVAIAITRDFPQHPFAWKVLGALFGQSNRQVEAVNANQRAVSLSPQDAAAHNNLGNTLKELGRFEEAEASYIQAITLKPNFIEAHSNLGVTLQELGRFEEAEASYNQAIALKPDYAEVHSNLGNTLKELGRLEEAEASYKQAIALKPDYADPLNNLGNTLQLQGRLAEAETIYKQAIGLKPNFAEAHTNLGATLQDLGRLEDAEANYKQAIGLKPDFAKAHTNLGMLLFGKGDDIGSLNCFQKSCDLKRGNSEINTSQRKSLSGITEAKISHDIEQFEYLASRGIKGSYFAELAIQYRRIKSEISWPSGGGVVSIDSMHRDVLDNSNKIIHLHKSDKVKQALSSTLDTDLITNNYFTHEFGLTYVDDFLTTDALNSLRDYLLEGTIWFDQKKGGYLGAYLSEGLASPLILQIANEIRERFPSLIKDHSLSHIWAYKYDSRSRILGSDISGIKIHADFAAVNVNFWVTQTESNLDPDSGGLVVYNKEAPIDWDFTEYNRNTNRIQAELKKNESGKTVIPYRGNRMVIFNSNLFHETDKYNFKDGYENRRINITMLFGKRR